MRYFSIRRAKAFLWPSIARALSDYCEPSYSQCGEDIALKSLLNLHRIRKGVFVDVGAYHPVHLSNTYRLYCCGWRGINIEPTPGRIDAFKLYRPRDISLAVGVTPDGKRTTQFYCFQQSELNTFSDEIAQQRIDAGHQLVCKRDVPVVNLNDILTRWIPEVEMIDVMSIDCEGLDESILKSLDWSRWSPRILIFEQDGVPFAEIPGLPIVSFLSSRGYELFARVGPSLIAHKHRTKSIDSN
ncbi:FkbM family methyltransferase [Tautonia rosea]|uniref:FkbM family methyltransferase n=1 Tax=Tautonia rosea TaxID=2728037 RepID=UPI001475148F|nr:FkbM family methyltransferase [Tautonia rosea]